MEIQKAKIVDLNADYAVVLTDSGVFKRVVKKGDMSVGGGIYITDRDIYKKSRISKPFKFPAFSKRLLQATGVMALLIMILFTQSFSPMSYAVISVDINPSIQLFVDADYNVVKIESMNRDGKIFLSEYDFIKHKSASSVLNELFTLAKKMDYLKSDQNEILIAAAIFEPSKVDQSLGDELIETVLSDVDYSIFEQENVVINAVTSNAKNMKAAEKEHLSIGQYEKGQAPTSVKPFAIVEQGKRIDESTKPHDDQSDEQADDNNNNNNSKNNNDNNSNHNNSDDKINNDSKNYNNSNNNNNNNSNNNDRKNDDDRNHDDRDDTSNQNDNNKDLKDNDKRNDRNDHDSNWNNTNDNGNSKSGNSNYDEKKNNDRQDNDRSDHKKNNN